MNLKRSDKYIGWDKESIERDWRNMWYEVKIKREWN